MASAFDKKTGDDLDNLQPVNFEARMGDTALPVVRSIQNFDNRLLVLVESDSMNEDRVAEVVDSVVQLTRQAPEGKRIAFGIFAERTLFTRDFYGNQRERRTEINDVIEMAESMGKRVAMFDALHDALKVFGPHEPGDTVLLIADAYDDNSKREPAKVEREYVDSGTRLLAALRQPLSRVGREFMWRNHDMDRTLLERITIRTGGAYTSFNNRFFTFAWRGYILEIKPPEGMNKPRKWKLRLRGTEVSPRRINLYYPEQLTPCNPPQTATR
jgi:SpoU rRNA methylase family enzyme